MNYLAHAYLSFGNPPILVGNMISDYVKGKQKENYPTNIQKGIILHRAIDNFTDTHHITKALKQFFRNDYRLYAGAFIDVVLDHFLAKWLERKLDLLEFTQLTYTNLEKFSSYFPTPFAAMFPYMQSQNWLYNYQYDWGIQKSFTGLMKRAAYITEVSTAYIIFEKEYEGLKKGCNEFIADIIPYATDKYNELISS